MIIIKIYDDDPQVLLEEIINAEDSQTWEYNKADKCFYPCVDSEHYEGIRVTHEIEEYREDSEDNHIILKIKGRTKDVQAVACGNFIYFLIIHCHINNIQMAR